jgi:hypothetical protein
MRRPLSAACLAALALLAALTLTVTPPLAAQKAQKDEPKRPAVAAGADTNEAGNVRPVTSDDDQAR